jgi:hypothetical protein
MVGELLGLLVVWTLVFALPVIVVWLVIRLVVVTERTVESRRMARRDTNSRADAFDTPPLSTPILEPEIDGDDTDEPTPPPSESDDFH